MENIGHYSTSRPAGREHFPLYPKGFIAIRVVQLVLALVITALCAFGIYLVPFSGNCFMIFVSLSTMIVTIWLIVAEFGIPKLYNYWAVLAMDIFLVVFWLCSFALLASQAAYLFNGTFCYADGTCYESTPDGLYLVFTACMAAAAGLGGLEFALFVTSMSIHSVMLHRHRKAGLHCNPLSSGAGPVTTTTHVGSEKNNAQVANDAAFQQPFSQSQAAPPYAHQNAGFNQQMAPQQQQQMFAPAPVHQQQPQQMQPHPQQQQNFYPQQPPTPLSAQDTGGSFAQVPPQQQTAAPPMPNAHEMSGNVYHPQ